MITPAAEARAWAKARQEWEGGNRAQRMAVTGGDGRRVVYAVRSRNYGHACVHCGAVLPPPPAVYIVEPDGDGWTCDCATGQHGGQCWHVAAVAMLLTQGEGAR